ARRPPAPPQRPRPGRRADLGLDPRPPPGGRSRLLRRLADDLAGYFTPCISLLIRGAIRYSSVPHIRSAQNPKVYPERADATVMPLSPLTQPAKMPDRLLPIAIDRNQAPIAKPVSRAGASLVVIDRPIGDR